MHDQTAIIRIQTNSTIAMLDPIEYTSTRDAKHKTFSFNIGPFRFINRYSAYGSATLLFMALLCLGCGDIDDPRHSVGAFDREMSGTLAQALRALKSKVCDCPPEVRVLHTSAEPDCDWVCGQITAEKATSSNRNARRSVDAAHETPMNDDDEFTAETTETTRQARDCYTVCPDWTVIGPHPCGEVQACLKAKNNYIDVMAGGSSTLDTRRTGRATQQEKR